MIHLITSRPEYYNEEKLKENDIFLSSASDFLEWSKNRKIIQLDTETNVVNRLIKRELYVVQIGDKEGQKQWVFDIINLSGLKLNYLKRILSDKTIEKIIHNSSFEYTIIKKEFNIDIDNIKDTMLASKILKTGLIMPKGFHGLAGCVRRYLNIEISKAEQTSFSTDPLSIEQIIYAATDVTMMGMLYDLMMQDLIKWNLVNTFLLECAVVRPYSDSMLFNFYLDKDKWKQIMQKNEEDLLRLTNEMHNCIKSELEEQCKELGFIQKQDEYSFSWGSSKFKNKLMKLIYPELSDECTTLPAFKSFYKTISSLDTDYNLEPLENYINRDFASLEKFFIVNYHNELNNLGMFTKKDTILINFNSPSQTLKLFQLINPEIEDTNKETIQKINHPLAKIFKAYMKAQKLYTSYGDNFLEACDEDGMLRLHDFNQILDTGRTSLKLYQLLPGKGPYRGCFYPEKGWKVVGIDYASQEFVIAASLSNETVILDAIKNNWDVHSISASLLFPKEWAACGEDPNPKSKPKTEEGDKFRSYSKKTSFGQQYILTLGRNKIPE